MPVPPPGYSETSEPLLEPGEGGTPRSEADHVPDDFKYSTYVSECSVSIRHAFVRKVYAILVAQIAVTAAVGCFIILNDGVREWALNHMWTFYVALFGAIGLMIGAFVTQRSYPTNMIFLALFTLCESYTIGLVSSLFDTRIVVEAVLITLVVFVGLTIFAMQTKYDITSWQVYLSAGLWALIGIGFVGIFFPWGSGMELAYSIIGALVFSGYIMVDTQLIMHKYHPEDEVAAAISLYLDIINLFLNILRILNEANNNN